MPKTLKKQNFNLCQKFSVIKCQVISAHAGEMVEVFKYIKSLQATEKPDYMKLNKLFRSILVNNTAGKTIRYDWMEKAAVHLEKTIKKNISSKGTTEANSSAENKNLPLGAIDLDKDQNFAIDANDNDSDDDQSNMDESEGSELTSEQHDALPMSVARISQDFRCNFIKDREEPSPHLIFKKKPSSPPS